MYASLFHNLEFCFDKFELSMEELVFYYNRMDIRGVCLAFIDECHHDLTGAPYSILPLVRPTASNIEAAERLKRDGDKVLQSMTNLASNLLKRPADKALRNQEVIARDGLNATTVNDDGELALCRPTKMSREIVNSIVGGAEKDHKSDDIRKLNKLTKSALMQIAEEEGVSLAEGSKGIKEDYLRAIVASRHPDKAIKSGGSGAVSTKETGANVEATTGDKRRTVEFNLLMAMTKTNLLALARREKVVVKGASTANKTKIIEAILAARGRS